MTVGLHEHADSREILIEKFHEKLARQFHAGKRARKAAHRWAGGKPVEIPRAATGGEADKTSAASARSFAVADNSSSFRRGHVSAVFARPDPDEPYRPIGRHT
ncbi:hypothetical protein [Burkholderia sp. BE17]|uniref:hypothetical protein n=1 Tax=Burkholderia sp. BE17 TaxID=2656644 RepID=UPI00128B981F|nr:hypothetical protein [Burkholderia sp. BE17]MPV66256.1 hypothetical protein [Burkholderia sp. BE17]